MPPQEQPPAVHTTIDQSFHSAEAIARHPSDPLRVPEGTLTAASLSAIQREIVASGLADTYDRLGIYNATLAHLERQRQQDLPDGKDRKLRIAYLAAMNEYWPKSVNRYFDQLQLYVQKKKEYDMQPTVEMATVENDATRHLESLAPLLQQRVRLGRYRALLFHKSQNAIQIGKEPIESAIVRSRNELPDRVVRVAPLRLGEKQTDSVDLRAYKGTDNSNPNDPSIIEASAILDRDIAWIMSDEEIAGRQPPGTPEPNLSPADALYVELLLARERSLFNEESALPVSSPNLQAERERIHRERKKLYDDRDAYLRSFGPGQLASAALHEVFREYGSSDGKPPREPGFKPSEYSMYRKQFDDETKAQIEKYRSYFNQMRTGGALSITFDVQMEQVWNKQISSFSLLLAEKYIQVGSLPLMLADKTTGVTHFAENYREKILGRLREHFGLPSTFDFSDQSQWNALPKEQQKAIIESTKKAMVSTKDAIAKNRPLLENSMKSYEGDLSLLEKLRSIRHPDDLISTPSNPKGLAAYMENGRLNDSILRERDGGILRAAQDHLLHVQMRADWMRHADSVAAYEKDLDDVMLRHFDRAIEWDHAEQEFQRLWQEVAIIYASTYAYGGHGILARTFPQAFRLSGKRALLLRPVNAPVAAVEDAWRILSRNKKFRSTIKRGARRGMLWALTAYAVEGLIDQGKQFRELQPITDERDRVNAMLSFLRSKEFQSTVNVNYNNQEGNAQVNDAYHRSIRILENRLYFLDVIARSRSPLPLPRSPDTLMLKSQTPDSERILNATRIVSARLTADHIALETDRSAMYGEAVNGLDNTRSTLPIDDIIYQNAKRDIKPSFSGGGFTAGTPSTLFERMLRVTQKPFLHTAKDSLREFEAESRSMARLSSFMQRASTYQQQLDDYAAAVQEYFEKPADASPEK